MAALPNGEGIRFHPVVGMMAPLLCPHCSSPKVAGWGGAIEGIAAFVVVARLVEMAAGLAVNRLVGRV